MEKNEVEKQCEKKMENVDKHISKLIEYLNFQIKDTKNDNITNVNTQTREKYVDFNDKI